MTLAQYRSRLVVGVRQRRITPAQASQLYTRAAKSIRPAPRAPAPIRQGANSLPRPDPITSGIYSLASKAPVPFVSQILAVNKLVESLPMPAQIALAPLILTPGLAVKAAGAVVDAGAAVLDAIGGLFSSGYTQAELDRNHAIVAAGMLPQPKDQGPGRRVVER